MSKHSIIAYKQDLEQFVDFIGTGNQDDFEALTTNTNRGWMAHMIESGITARSVHRKISSIRAFFNYLRKQNILDKDPLAKLVLPKVPKKIIQDIPAADLGDLFRHFPWHEHENGERDQLIILLLYSTGMRLSELLGLKISDIDLRRQSLTVTGKRNKQRIIPIHPELAEVLKQYIKNTSSNYLITASNNKQAYPMLIYRIVNQYLRLFSSALKTSPHVLRHSFATHMLNNGANLMAIKDLLGHASLSATQVYTKNSFEKLKAVHKLHPRN